MNAVLMEMMRPEIQASCIKSVVDALRKVGHEDTEIKTVIMESYALTAEEAAKYLKA